MAGGNVSNRTHSQDEETHDFLPRGEVSGRTRSATMNYKITFPAVLLSLGILNGCGAGRPSKFYELSAPGNSTVAANPAPYPVTLLLGRMTTSNLYRDDHIVYTSSSRAMGTYEYQRWAEPPAEMITDILLRELRASGRYLQIYSLGSNVRGDYLLRGHLYDFREIDKCPRSR